MLSCGLGLDVGFFLLSAYFSHSKDVCGAYHVLTGVLCELTFYRQHGYGVRLLTLKPTFFYLARIKRGDERRIGEVCVCGGGGEGGRGDLT